MKKYIIFIVAMFFVACGGEDKAPIEVSLYTQGRSNSIDITSLVDSVKIKNVIINRKKCDVNTINSRGWITNFSEAIKDKPMILNFGQTSSKIFTLCDKILEVNVETDYGDWTFSFN